MKREEAEDTASSGSGSDSCSKDGDIEGNQAGGNGINVHNPRFHVASKNGTMPT